MEVPLLRAVNESRDPLQGLVRGCQNAGMQVEHVPEFAELRQLMRYTSFRQALSQFRCIWLQDLLPRHMYQSRRQIFERLLP